MAQGSKSEMTERLLIEVPDADSAIGLVDELKHLHAELAPLEGGRCEVQVELEDEGEQQIGAALEAVERWLAGSGIEETRVRLHDRSYTVERRAESAVRASRAERVAQNEALREVNERIGKAAERAALEGPTLFVCECSNAECSEQIEVTPTEYKAARSQPALFLLAPGHEISEFERVIDQNDRFALVEGMKESQSRTGLTRPANMINRHYGRGR